MQQVITNFHGNKKRRNLHPRWERVVLAITENDEDVAFHEMQKFGKFRQKTIHAVEKMIDQECSTVCSPSTNSCFRQSCKEEFESFSFSNQTTELEKHTPVLHSLLRKAASYTGRTVDKNKFKTRASLNPGITTAAAVLFNCRSHSMNSHQLLTGFTLLEGGGTKRTFGRLGMRNMCSSYNYVLQKQSEFGEGFDKKVTDWIEQLESIQNTDNAQTTASTNSFQLAMDNVDMRVKTRYTSRDLHHGADYHMANIIAVRNSQMWSLV